MLHSTVQIIAAAPDSADGVRLIRALDDDLRARYPGVALHGLRAEDVRDQRFAWRGVARRLLAALETEARKLGYVTLRLETALGQPEAIALYRSVGYVDMPPFGDYIGHPASVCFEKRLT